jgi:hypothetical protein
MRGNRSYGRSRIGAGIVLGQYTVNVFLPVRNATPESASGLMPAQPPPMTRQQRFDEGAAMRDVRCPLASNISS